MAKTLEEARLSLEFISKKDLEALWTGVVPPEPVLQLLKAMLAVLGDPSDDWESMKGKKLCKDAKQFVSALLSFDPKQRAGVVELLQQVLEQEGSYPECLAFYSSPLPVFCQWCRAVCAEAGGQATFGEASEEAIAKAKETGELYKNACKPPGRAGTRSDSASAAAGQGGDSAAASQGGGDPRYWNWELLVRSMVSGEVLAKLHGASPDWTFRDIRQALQKEDLNRGRGMKWQIMHDGQPIDAHASLSTLGINTEPGSQGEVGVVAVSFIDTDKLMSEDEAKQRLEAAREQIDSLRKADIKELASFAKPPQLCELVCCMLCALFEVEQSWAGAKRLLSDSKILTKLHGFDAEETSDDALIGMQWYIETTQLDPDRVRMQSMAAHGLCLWLIAVYNIGLVHAHRRQSQPEEEEEEE